MTAVWEMTYLDPVQTLVLLALADNASDEGKCYPSLATIARKTRLHERTIRKHLTELEMGGQLTRHERPGRSTVYVIHPGPTSRGDVGLPRADEPPTPGPRPPHPGPSAPHNHQVTVNEPSGESTAADAAPAPEAVKHEKRTKKRTRIAEDATPTDADREFALARVPDMDVDSTYTRFRDHHLKVGSLMADWRAAWRTWVGKITDEGFGYVRRIRAVDAAQRTYTPAEWRELQARRQVAG